MIMTNPQKGCQLPGILLQKVWHWCDGAVLKQLGMLHPLIYESWTPPDHVCLIIHGAAAAPLAQPLCPWQPLPPPCFHPKHVTTHAKLCQPPATSLGGDCLQVVSHLVVVTAHRAPDFQPLAHFAQVAAIHSIVHAALQVCTDDRSVNALRLAVN